MSFQSWSPELQRTRVLVGSPARASFASWEVFTGLLSSSMERSEVVPAGSVASALSTLSGLGAALLAYATESNPFVLVDDDVYVSIWFETGDASFKIEENLDPIIGTSRATAGWKLYLPITVALASAISQQISENDHLAAGPAPAYSSKSMAPQSESTIDFDAIRAMGI